MWLLPRPFTPSTAARIRSPAPKTRRGTSIGPASAAAAAPLVVLRKPLRVPSDPLLLHAHLPGDDALVRARPYHAGALD